MQVLANLAEQIPEPKIVLALGSCGLSGGVFREAYNVIGGVDKVIPVDVYVPGCPPKPEAIIDGVVTGSRADRAGIIRDISRALALRQVNVDELHTECTSAPMSGEILFNARAKLRVPLDVAVEDLCETLEEIASDLMVDLTLGEIPESEV